MLIVLMGPSGVGKTSVIEALVDRHGWHPVRTFMTRPPRPGEQFKSFVTSDRFSIMLDRGEFHWVNDLYGNRYGTSRHDVRIAIENQAQPWIIDFPLAQRERAFRTIPHAGVILLPTDWEQLAEQLHSAGRDQRIEEVRKEYYSVYLNVASLTRPEDLQVQNPPGRIETTIYSLVSHFGEGCREHTN